jgi:sigma-B regulation protein RsbU (phosphoserine phosphatase)
MQFSSSVVNLQPGDTLVLFSDGVSEAMDPEQNEYGVDRLRKAVGDCPAGSVSDMQEAILESVRQFARGERQADDVTLLLLRYTGAAAGLRPAAD